MAVIRWIGFSLVLLVAAAVVLVVVARLSDGPIGPIAGGPLRRGQLIPSPVDDWSFVSRMGEVELQLVNPPRSRTTWIVVHDHQAYIPCGFLDVPLWKQWPHEAMRDGRAIVRIAGKRYPVQLARVDDPELQITLGKLVADKYELRGEQALDPHSVWFFRLDPRSKG
jgi:hypothetical protein